MSHYFVRSRNNVNYYVEQYVGGERKVFMERWHCIVCLCEWCGWNNHKILLSNYHICQSTAVGCVGGREIPCGANCVITVSWKSYSQAQVLLCVLKYLEDNPIGTLSSVFSWLTVGDNFGEWCVLELLELQNLLRKLVFLWVSIKSLVPAYICRSVSSLSRPPLWLATACLSLPSLCCRKQAPPLRAMSCMRKSKLKVLWWRENPVRKMSLEELGKFAFWQRIF